MFLSQRERCSGCRGCERVVVLGGERGWWWWQVVVLGEMVMTCRLLIYASLTMFLILWVLMMKFDDVLEDRCY
ncbi:hypothetical protein HanHA300_Chr15g0551251 [Helianthus annuus]|nr:hypothetical protein HanHA300_Chr15g0551251 [Helianthus annuus]